MASNTTTDTVSLSELNEDTIAINTNLYVAVAALALMIYDTALIAAEEFSLIWGKKFRLGSILYVLARYGSLLEITTNFILSISTSPSKTVGHLLGIRISVYSLGEDLGLLVARAYVVSGRNKWLIAVLLLLTVSYLGIALVKIVLTSTTNPPAILFTLGISSVIQAYYKRIILFTGSLLNIIVLLTDAITVAVTFLRAWDDYRSFSLLKELRSNKNTSLSVLLLQQGVIRFIIIFVWSLEGSITEKLLNPNFAGIDLPLENVISAILVTRFMLQLKQRREYSSCASPSKIRWIANITPTSSSKLRATVRCLNETIVEEFGDHEDNAAVFVGPRDTDEESSQKIPFGPRTLHNGPTRTRGLSLVFSRASRVV
ncbi:hypothetical protein M422DRAFT_241187 [Sphaerobolus stellatus SS14]|nr:hypothetical protein M422DRAFT_241187 [Sphaerobolus stellatus SS14]